MKSPRMEGASRYSWGKRLLLGWVFAVCVLTLSAGVLEWLLSRIGVGQDSRYYRTEIDQDGVAWYRENRSFTATYFPEALIRRPQAMKLPVRKQAGSVRVFVLGSSAAMGDPEASFSMARMLEVMLESAYPEMAFEVVNAGITAINSHVVKRVAKDCSRLEPDLFIVYEGNNEVIGPFGPAGVLAPFLASPRAVSLTVALRRSRLGQVIGRIVRGSGSSGDIPGDWGGMGMFLDHAITVDDPRMDGVLRAFEHNLVSVVKYGRAVACPTLLCTVLTNERDFAPFLSVPSASLTEEGRMEVERLLEEGDLRFGAGNRVEAEASYRGAWERDSQRADIASRLGRLALGAGDAPAAQEWLSLARDLDGLRFRTDSRLNARVREVAERHAVDSRLVDLAKLAAKESRHGVVGDEFLYEHVHLSFFGAFRVADWLFEEAVGVLAERGKLAEVRAQGLSYAAMRERLGYTVYEQAMILHEMLRRFSRPPFTGQLDHGIRIDLWRGRQQAVDKVLGTEGAVEGLRVLYERAICQHGDDWVLMRNYGMALVGLGYPEEAIPWLERAKSLLPDDADLLFALGTARERSGDGEGALEVFGTLRLIEPRYPGLPQSGAGLSTRME